VRYYQQLQPPWQQQLLPAATAPLVLAATIATNAIIIATLRSVSGQAHGIE